MHPDLLLSSYHYHLPETAIAQHPADKRDASRLLVLDAHTQHIQHRIFSDLADLIPAGDLLVVNNTKVFPARFLGHKDSGGKVEVFLLSYPRVLAGTIYETEALLKCSKRPKPGSRLLLADNLECIVQELREDGKALLQLQAIHGAELHNILYDRGNVPLPPYIHRESSPTTEDSERYQTVYAAKEGAVAAPTAGLHFSRDLLNTLADRGIKLATVTLHVGYGTFSPVRTEQITEHQIHSEYMELSQETATLIKNTQEKGHRIWAVGTTTVRALEFAAQQTQSGIAPFQGWCDLYIYPGFPFRIVDNLITNFHLPSSSLMFLVAALCGRTTLLNCYQEAIEKGYRFYSYGDAMVIRR